MTRVVVVEDHTLLRQSLVKTINAEDGFEVVLDLTDAAIRWEAIPILAGTLPQPLGLPFEPPASRTRS